MAKSFFSTSSNPAARAFTKAPTINTFERAEGDVMTIDGAINKSAILLGLLVIAASVTWTMAATAPGTAMSLAIGGAIGGLIVAIALMFKQEWAPQLAWLYAVLEGLFLGAISSAYNAAFEGIVIQAVGLTLCILALMLVLYKYEVIKVTEKFRSVMTLAIGAFMMMYMVSFLVSMFGGDIGFLHDGGPLAIGICLVAIVVASLSLLLDFDLIERGAAAQAPKYMEWYAGFALLMTLVWLYIELLRLIAMLSSE